MVVQGKGAWKGSSKPKDQPASNRPLNSNSPQQHSLNGGNDRTSSNMHTLDDLGPVIGGPGNKPIPEYSGRPTNGFSLSEMFFPWHKLWSITTIILIVDLIYFVIILIYAGAKMPPAFSSSNRMGGPSAEVLKVLQAKWTPSIVRGEIQRLLLPVFMHSGILHIALNSFFLARFGWLTEVRYNSWRMLGIFIFAGIGSNCASALITPSSVSCGASGALFGIMGACLVFVIFHWRQLRNAMCEAIMIVFILAINLLIGFLQPDSGTDNWAHLFGAVFGMLAAVPLIYLWRTDIKRKTEKLFRLGSAIFAIIAFVLMFGLIWLRK